MPAIMLTAEMLREQGFEERSRRVDGEDRRYFGQRFIVEGEDDLLVDALVNATGQFLSEEAVAGCHVEVEVDIGLNILVWRFEPPHAGINPAFAIYPFPLHEANAVRFLTDILGLDLPVEVVRIGDELRLSNGCLGINGVPVVVEYPATEYLFEIEPSREDMGSLIYRDDAGQRCRIGLDEILGYRA